MVIVGGHMKITICDDNGAILTGLQQMLQKMYTNEFQIETTRLPENLLEEWKKSPNKVADIILMDIEYPYSDKNGIEIIGEIQKIYPHVKVIFITGNIHYAQDIFEVVPSSFLVKPINSDRLHKAIEKAREQIGNEQNETAYFRMHGSVVKIPFETIQYIESVGHQIKVHTKETDMIFRMKLVECMERIPNSFWLIHQSYIVNSKYVRGMTKDAIELWDRTRLPVSRSKYREIKNRFLDEIEKG